MPRQTTTARRIPLRWLAIALTLLLLAGPTASSARAQAAPPPNDEREGAVWATGVPFSYPQDTAGATAGADDPDGCGSGPSVWFAFAAAESAALEANLNGSNTDPVLGVYDGGLNPLGCNDDSPQYGLASAVAFDAVAGETYYFVVGSNSGDTGGVTFNLVPYATPPDDPTIEVEVAIDPAGTVAPRTGGATVTGTVTCHHRQGSFSVLASLEQRAERGTVRAETWVDGGCDPGATVRWSAALQPANGGFAGGRATASAYVSGCDVGDPDDDGHACDEDRTGPTPVRLRVSQDGGTAESAAAPDDGRAAAAPDDDRGRDARAGGKHHRRGHGKARAR